MHVLQTYLADQTETAYNLRNVVQENNLSVFKSMLRTIDFSYTLLGKL